MTEPSRGLQLVGVAVAILGVLAVAYMIGVGRGSVKVLRPT